VRCLWTAKICATTAASGVAYTCASRIYILWSDPHSREGKSQKVSDSRRNDVSPLTQGLRYRAACDLTSAKVRAYWTILMEEKSKDCTSAQLLSHPED